MDREVDVDAARRGVISVLQRNWASRFGEGFAAQYSTHVPFSLLDKGNEVNVFKFAVQYTGGLQHTCAPREDSARELSKIPNSLACACGVLAVCLRVPVCVSHLVRLATSGSATRTRTAH